jgi:trehalose 6-phosphate synthase
MRWPARLTAGLVITLGLLTWGASLVIRQVTQAWFERDLTLRAELAVSGARLALVNAWTGAPVPALRNLLSEISQDERVLGVAACRASDFTLIVATPGFPSAFACDRFGLLVKPVSHDDDWVTWTGTDNSVLGGTVHITAAPIRSPTDVLGYLVLIHDLGFVSRRHAQVERLLLLAFGVLAVTAATVILLGNRLARWQWTRDLRASLFLGGKEKPEFSFVMHDVRALADRIAADRDMDRDVEAWTPKRLKDAVARHFENDQVIIVANREPYIHQRGEDGVVRVKHPASGLVTALEPVMRACSGVWISHGGGNADREMADAKGHVAVPPDAPSYTLRRMWLTKEEEHGYYYGFSNEGLWALCHTGHTRPMFRSSDWKQYKAVNKRFADAVAEEAKTDSPVVLVQDYHFALAPKMIRERLPKATIIMFWHIPWPTAERFGICPEREELLEGMLGADILGFHTQAHCNNFVETVERYIEARTDKERGALAQKGHMTFVRPYPISIEWPPKEPPLLSAAETRRKVFKELGLKPDALLGVGVDRLDYTKGIEERFLAVDCLLSRYAEYRGRFVFLQVAAPSRSEIERYQKLSDDVEALVKRINDKWGTADYKPIIYRRKHHEPEQVYELYRAADICYVSSIHDGMNLVAKEFVASRDDDDGVLVLSQFTGAAQEMTEAIIVNPYDIDQAGDALAASLSMERAERRARMHYMRAHLAEFNVYRWAGRMLVDAARLRKRESMWQRLTPGAGGQQGGNS